MDFWLWIIGISAIVAVFIWFGLRLIFPRDT
jgi:hypothetical protein